MTKTARQHKIAELLEASPVTSQSQLVDALAGLGIEATQATVSRDLEELGAIKVRVPGGDLVYAIPEAPSDHVVPLDHLRRVLGEWVASVESSGNLVVVRTPPGSAHVVGSALDRSGMPEVLGTVAGDDTLILVAAESSSGTELAISIRSLAGIAPDSPSTRTSTDPEEQ